MQKAEKTPNVMLTDDILMKEKFRDGVLVFMNDRRDKSVEKKRKCKQNNELVQTIKFPSTEYNGSTKIMMIWR